MSSSVSVIIPTYNRLNLLREAIESVRRQTIQDIEIVVVDDGSDESVSDRISAHGGKMRFARQENRGLNAARNVGLGMACGDFIALLDDDDLWLPFKTELQLAVMDRFPEAAFVFSDFTIFDEKGIKALKGLSTWNDFPASWRVGLEYSQSGREMGLPSAPDGEDYRIFLGKIYHPLLYEPYVLPSTALVRRRAIQGDAPFPEDNIHCGDWQFFAELTRNAPCVFVSLPTAMNRSHGDAVRLTRKSPRIRTLDRLKMISQVWRSDREFMAMHGAEVYGAEREVLQRLALLCVTEGRRDEAIEYLERWRRLPSGRLGMRGRLLFLAAHIPGGSRLAQLIGRMRILLNS